MTTFSAAEWSRLQKIADEDGVVLVLRTDEIRHLMAPLKLTAAEQEMENRLAALAKPQNAVGLYTPAKVWIPSSAFNLFPAPPLPDLPSDLLKELNWDADELEELRTLTVRQDLDDVRDRARAAIGRLSCHPGFLTEVSTLRELWRKLPEQHRSALPLRRTMRMSPLDLAETLIHSPEITEFGARFEGFLNRWQLMGITCWDLPDPLEFHPHDLRYRDGSESAASMTTTVSALIPLKRNDHRISEIVRDNHIQFRQQNGLSELDRKWQSYAQIAMISRLVFAIKARVRANPRLSWPVAELNGILGDVLFLDEGHIRRLWRIARGHLEGQ